jgi:hypothetical protein
MYQYYNYHIGMKSPPSGGFAVGGKLEVAADG